MSLVTSSGTATSTAASVGTAADRRYVRIANMSQTVRIRAGESDITGIKGIVIEPGESQEFRLTSSAGTEIYAISEGASVRYELAESFV